MYVTYCRQGKLYLWFQSSLKKYPCVEIITSMQRKLKKKQVLNIRGNILSEKNYTKKSSHSSKGFFMSINNDQSYKNKNRESN